MQQSPQHADTPVGSGVHQHPHQHQGDKDGHGVVKAGFDLQGAGHPFIQRHPGALDHAEHRRRIGGANNAAQQQPHPPVHAHHPGGKGAHQGGGNGDAKGGQAESRLQTQPEGTEAGTQAAVEQDDRQGNIADHIGGGEVIELDTADAVLAGEHAHHQENQQRRHPEPGTQGAQQQAGKHQAGADKKKQVQRVQAESIPRESGFYSRIAYTQRAARYMTGR